MMLARADFVFRSFTVRKVLIVAFLVVLAAPGMSRGEVHWTRRGGPDGSSHTAETGLPVSWTEENIVWRAGLKGWGQSMPVIWGDSIFLTTALDDGRRRVVFCIDRKSGKTLWEQVAWTGEPEPRTR